MRSTVLAVAAMILVLVVSYTPGSAVSLEPTVTIELTNLEVTDMPLSVRDVPPHPDDAAFSHPGPIANTDYKLRGLLAVSLPVVTSGKPAKKADEVVSSKDKPNPPKFSLNAKWMFAFGEKAERNYTNAPGTDQRGYGAALTYVRPELNGILPPADELWLELLLNVTPELVWANNNTSLSLSYARITAETGWDRYDELEVRDHVLLGYSLPIGVGQRIGNSYFGLKYYPVFKSGAGKDAGIKGGISVFGTSAF